MEDYRILTKIEDLEKLKKDPLYYHCAWCGKIFYDDQKKQLCADIYLMTGKKQLPKVLEDHKITSGLCEKCMDKEILRIEKRKKERRKNEDK